jgi:uncharacterized protein YuzB (UPF0349 family)
MKVAILTNVSDGTPWADIVMPGRLRYCIRHGYAMVCLACSYRSSHMEVVLAVKHLLERFDLVWSLGADCLITNHTMRIEEVGCLGPHMSICEEGLGPHALVNGDSIVWRATKETIELIDEMVAAEAEWSQMQFWQQQWLMIHCERLSHCMTIAPKRAFNSVHLGNTNHWQHGDFVYHPCGNSPDIRCNLIREHLERVVT